MFDPGSAERDRACALRSRVHPAGVPDTRRPFSRPDDNFYDCSIDANATGHRYRSYRPTCANSSDLLLLLLLLYNGPVLIRSVHTINVIRRQTVFLFQCVPSAEFTHVWETTSKRLPVRFNRQKSETQKFTKHRNIICRTILRGAVEFT